MTTPLCRRLWSVLVCTAALTWAGRPATANDNTPPPESARRAAASTADSKASSTAPNPAPSANQTPISPPPPPENDREQGRWGWGIAIGVPTAILSAGFVNWYISHRINFDLARFRTRPRGWFGPDTHVGGHDNIGHLYANYVCQIEVAELFEAVGYSRNRADLYATLVTAFTFNMVEFLDAFTDYGWEYSDTLFNAGGQIFGLLSRRYGLDRYLQLRISWLPSKRYIEGGIPRYEVVEDYSGQRFYLVFHTAGAFAPTQANNRSRRLWRYLMPGIYYDTRGYRPPLHYDEYDQRQRNLGLVMLIDLAAIVRERWPKSGWARGGAGFLRYFQPPFLGIGYGYDLNHGRWHAPDYSLTFSGRF